MIAYEVEVHFIGEPEYYYYENRADAERAVENIEKQPAESAYFGLVKETAKINEIELSPNQYIEGDQIITESRPVELIY